MIGISFDGYLLLQNKQEIMIRRRYNGIFIGNGHWNIGD